jgi:hypothetical protein
MTFSHGPGRRAVRRAILFLLLASTPLVAACGRTEQDRNRGDLVAARRQWQAQRLTSYDFRFQNQCFCAPAVTSPVILEVRNGSITGATRVDTGVRLGPETFLFYRTVDGIFDLISESIDEGAVQVDVQYDAARGYPLSVFIDRDQRIADEEVRIQTGDLVPR